MYFEIGEGVFLVAEVGTEWIFKLWARRIVVNKTCPRPDLTTPWRKAVPDYSYNLELERGHIYHCDAYSVSSTSRELTRFGRC